MKNLGAILTVSLGLALSGCNHTAQPYTLPNGKKVFAESSSEVTSSHKQFILYTKETWNDWNGEPEYQFTKDDLYARGMIESVAYEKDDSKQDIVLQSGQGGSALLGAGDVNQDINLKENSALRIKFKTNQGRIYYFNVLDGEGATKESIYESLKPGDSAKIRIIKNPCSYCYAGGKIILEERDTTDSIEAWEIEKI